MMTQADRIIKKFGGAYSLAAKLGVSVSTVYRWTYPKPRGTGGLIPAAVMPQILLAAEIYKIRLTTTDLSPLESKIK